MRNSKSGPLTDQHLKLLNKLLAATVETAAFCAKCEACTLDVAQEAKKNAEQKAVAEKIKATFFPGAK